MKKQFFRVKQLADQTFSRAGKTEALTDDLQEAEKRVEFIRMVCLSMGKKMPQAPSGHDNTSKEKRWKKNQDYILGSSMFDIPPVKENILSEVVTKCCQLQINLGKLNVDHEMGIEAGILAPLINVCENDCPNIAKQKTKLTKLILDMDSLRTRYQTSAKHGGSGPTGSKIKDELEEAECKVDQARESLACDILQLIARETELSALILNYVESQKKYHLAAIQMLEQFIPEMEQIIKESRHGPVFGRPLEEHLRVTGRKIAYPIELCVCGLLEVGTNEEGIFRVTPAASRVRRMKVGIDANYIDIETAVQYRDPHMFAGVLKSYLRELPEPLLTHKLYDNWMNGARMLYSGDTEGGRNCLAATLKSLPQANFDNLSYLIKFLSSLSSNKQSHKMSPQNLAIVIAPNVIWSPTEDLDSLGFNMNAANLHSIIVETLVSSCDWFFPGEVEFYITMNSVLPINGDNSESMQEYHGGMKRAQSNSSLSDHNSSPPPESPKPAARVRKQKPPAPNPPGGKTVKEGRASFSEDEKFMKFSATLDEEKREKHVEKNKPALKDAKHDDEEHSQPLKNYEIVTMQAERKAEDNKLASEMFIKAESTEFAAREGKLDKRNSKSGEDLSKSVLVRPSGVTEPPYSTLDRKRLPRPTPAPRTSLEVTAREDDPSRKKPAIPERPDNLQRPHFSSFRVARSGNGSAEKESKADSRSLEKVHTYSIDKQQVEFHKVTNVKPGDTLEKPEKPKKPDSLVLGLGHQRAASEGSIIDTMSLSGDGAHTPTRLARPPPPPPPPTAAKRESTNL